MIAKLTGLKKSYFYWASGSLATGSVYNAMALFALFYMTSVLGVSPALAGVLLFVTKMYDAITDPLMGTISDRTRHPLGPRRPYLVIGSIMLGLSFAIFFSAPNIEGAWLIVFVVFALLLQSTGYTIYSVPYLAMSPDLAKTYDERTKIMSLRVMFLILAIMIGSVGAPLLVEAGGDGGAGYRLLGIVLGCLSIVSGIIAFYGTTGTVSKVVEAPTQNLLKNTYVNAIAVFKNSPFRLLTIIKLLQLVVLALSLSCMPYFFKYVLERPVTDISVYLMIFTVVGLLSPPLWNKVIDKFGKRDVYVFSIICYAIGMASWFFWTEAESEVFFYFRAVFLGIMANGTLLCALALLPDTMEYDRLISGENRQGVMSGIFTTVEKFSIAIGSLLIGLLLSYTGLITSSDPTVTQPDSALLAIRFGVSLLPALFCLAAVPFLLRYRLDKEMLLAAAK
jgi:GPH family glycoside/pentoside/hexuronide:cation symporter